MIPIEQVQVLRPQQFKFDFTYGLMQKLLNGGDDWLFLDLYLSYQRLALNRPLHGLGINLHKFLYDPLIGYFNQNHQIDHVIFVDGKFLSEGDEPFKLSKLEEIAKKHNSIPLILLRVSEPISEFQNDNSPPIVQ